MEPKLYRTKRSATGGPSLLQLSLITNIFLVLLIVYLSSFTVYDAKCEPSKQGSLKETLTTWHGGHPTDEKSGSCWCGTEDRYCMCTPNLAIDLIITSGPNVWLVRRKDTSQLATMGGFVDVHETVEDAVLRELREEMSLTLNEDPVLVGIYSDPRRDNRRRTVSAVFAVDIPKDLWPFAGDDAKDTVLISIDEIEKHTFFADHRTILLDYRAAKKGEPMSKSTSGDFADDIVRSLCGILSSRD